MLKIFSFLLVLNCSLLLQAQLSPRTKELIENYLENFESNADFTQIIDELEQFEKNPIQINKADIEELIKFPFFSLTDASKIINHRKFFGNFLTIEELQVLKFTPNFIELIKPYILFTESKEAILKKNWALLKKGNFENTVTFGRKLNVIPTNFNGDNSNYQLRMRYYLPNAFSFALTYEKDAGETFLIKNKPAYISGHISLSNLGNLTHLTIGDYVLQMGEGLILGSGIGIGKSANVLSIKRTGATIRPYRGVNEFLFHRGIATNWRFKNLNFRVALSSMNIDASINNDSSFTGFNSLDLDGLHRTPSEINKRSALNRKLVHSALEFKQKSGLIGCSFNQFMYNLAPLPSENLYNYFRPNTKNQTFLNTYFHKSIANVFSFGEFAYLNSNNSYGLSLGANAALSEKIEIGLHLRKYSNGFISPFSNAFSVLSNAENGLFFASKITFTKKLQLSMYKDFFQNTWITYRRSNLFNSNDLLFQLDYIPSKTANMYIRTRFYDKYFDKNMEYAKVLTKSNIHMVRLHASVQLNKTFELEIRGEVNTLKSNVRKDKAFLIFADVNKNFSTLKQQLRVRVYTYAIPNFDARIFAFEDQLQYVYNITGFYGTGNAMYLMYQIKPVKNLRLGARIGINSFMINKNYTTNKNAHLQLSYQL